MKQDSDAITVEGVVSETLPGGTFRIKLSTEGFEGHGIVGKISGKMRMHNIRIVPGDRVQVEMSEHNIEEGRIIYRFK
ncbi:MAG TPA: translation initiation factor IF-1 [Candidatus Gracilibacteria bacterium]